MAGVPKLVFTCPGQQFWERTQKTRETFGGFSENNFGTNVQIAFHMPRRTLCRKNRQMFLRFRTKTC